MPECVEESIWLTVPEAIEYLRVSKTTIYDCMKDGRLPFYYIKGTRQRRVKKSDLQKLMVPGSPGDVEEE